MSSRSENFKKAAEHFIDLLKKYHTTTVDSKAEEECIVCKDRLCEIDGCTNHEHEEPARLPCGHVIGIKCATTWFSESQQCPMCRAEVWESLDPKGSYWF